MPVDILLSFVIILVRITSLITNAILLAKSRIIINFRHLLVFKKFHD